MFFPVFGLMIWAIFAIMYFVPSAVAMYRHKQNLVAIFALNLLLGWTVIGWVASLVWALTNENVPGSLSVQSLPTQAPYTTQPFGAQAPQGWACTACRAPVTPGAAFCPNCGTKIAWPG